jgi:hypothetical protein
MMMLKFSKISFIAVCVFVINSSINAQEATLNNTQTSVKPSNEDVVSDGECYLVLSEEIDAGIGAPYLIFSDDGTWIKNAKNVQVDLAKPVVTNDGRVEFKCVVRFKMYDGQLPPTVNPWHEQQVKKITSKQKVVFQNLIDDLHAGKNSEETTTPSTVTPTSTTKPR